MNKKNIEAIYPLSPSQQGMLFNTLSTPNSSIYVEQLSCTLQGKLDILTFEQAWQRVVNRHPALRTAFVWKNQDEPMQVVLQQVAVNVNYQDWRELKPSVQQEQLKEFLKADRNQSFNLSKPPLMRLSLLQLSDFSYIFIWNNHHIVIDGWCLSILFKEFLSFYQAISKNQDLQLQLTRPYKDYINWLRQQDLGKAEKFWRQTLQNFSEPTTLGLSAEPQSLSNSIIQSYGKHEASLPTSITTALQTLAKQNRITFNTLVQGIWALLLSRYSNVVDVVFGITVSGRPMDLLGSESMIGLFINTLPLRIKITPEKSFWAWLQDIYAHNLELRQYEYSPAGQISQWSEITGGIPLYESLLVFQNYPIDNSIFQSLDLGINISNLVSQGAETQYPLTILVNIDAECKFSIIYDRSRFDSKDVFLILKHLLELLQSIVVGIEYDLTKLWKQIPADEIPHARPKLKTEQQRLNKKLLNYLTPVEEILSNIWTQVLGLEEVSINDNFFDLGGHSLLATQVMSRVRKTFQIELPLGHIFAAPTIADLAKRIENAQRTEATLKAPPLLRVSRNDYLPLSFAQERLWFIEKLYPDNITYNELSAVQLVGSLNIVALEQSLGEIVSRHEVLRTNFVMVNGQIFQANAPNFKINLPVVDLRLLPQIQQQLEIQRLTLEELQCPFDLSQGLLLRCTLLWIDENKYIFLFTIHHIVSDGWSMGVFIRELTTLYAAFCAGETSPLPELPIQYADFAVWQKQWLQGDVLQTQLDYWEKQLENLPVLQLPTDFPRPPQRTFRGAKQTLILPKSLSQALQQLSTNAGVTLFMTLLAAFQTPLHYYTNQDDIVVGTDVANRNHAETEPLIGFFVNQLVLRTDFAGNPSFGELLERVRDRTLSAYTYQDLPFDKLVEVLNPERDLSRSPLFQVKCILQNAPMPALELSGLTLSLLDIDKKVAEFDLLLVVTDTDQGLIADLKYNTDLFKSATVSQMLQNLEKILSRIVSQPDIKLHELKAMLVEADNQQRIVKEQEYQKTIQQNVMNIKRRSK